MQHFIFRRNFFFQGISFVEPVSSDDNSWKLKALDLTFSFNIILYFSFIIKPNWEEDRNMSISLSNVIRYLFLYRDRDVNLDHIFVILVYQILHKKSRIQSCLIDIYSVSHQQLMFRTKRTFETQRTMTHS